MIPLANSGALWREPKTVALGAQRVVLAETEPGVFELIAANEAANYGGERMIFEQSEPGVFEPIDIDTATGDALVRHVRIGTTILPA
jgi:hypothetical protein